MPFRFLYRLHLKLRMLWTFLSRSLLRPLQQIICTTVWPLVIHSYFTFSVLNVNFYLEHKPLPCDPSPLSLFNMPSAIYRDLEITLVIVMVWSQGYLTLFWAGNWLYVEHGCLWKPVLGLRAVRIVGLPLHPLPQENSPLFIKVLTLFLPQELIVQRFRSPICTGFQWLRILYCLFF